jgi:hypothetical protein
MKQKKKIIMLMLLSVANCSRAVRKDSLMFSLEDDRMIIRTPDVSELHNSEASGDVFKVDESTPYKNGVFFMQDDFFVEVHDHAQPPMNPHSDVIEVPNEEPT